MSDPTPWIETDDGEWLRLMAGNEDALRLVRDFSFISHVYDDLIDKDEVDDARLHAMFWKLLIALPMNNFYREHEAMLRPLVITGIVNWRAANEMEAVGSREELAVSHVIRHSCGDIALMAMALAGGQDHAMKNARRCRLLMQTGSLDHYLKEHQNAKQA